MNGILADQLIDMIKDVGSRTGVELEDNLDEVKVYTAERLLHLSMIVDQPGYLEAVYAEAINVALKSARGVVLSADLVDTRLFGLIQGAIGMAARALAGPVV